MPAAGPQNTRAKQKKRIRKPPAKKPAVSKTLLRNSQRQASTYQSQGRAVEKVAKEQKGRAKRKRAEVRDVKGSSDLGRADTYKKTEQYRDLKKKVRAKRLQRAFREDDVRTIKRISREESAASAAASPVLRVLEETTRPLHAVAGAARHDVKQVKKYGVKGLVGHGSLKEAGKGIRNETKNTFSDVLKEAGVKNKGVAGAVGFGLDVALDPTTYVTLGASSPARAASRSAARKAERDAVKSGSAKQAGKQAQAQALKRGATPKAAKRVRKQAEAKHLRRAGEKAARKVTTGATNRGLSVRFAGQQVPGVTRATAAAKRAPRAVARKSRVDQTRVGRKLDRGQQKVRDAVRSTAAEVNPNITPVGADREAYQAMRRAARTARAGSQRGDVYAALSAKSFVDRIGEENFQRVLYAIEEGTVKDLPKNLRGEAERWIGKNRKRLKRERSAGIEVGDVTAGDKGVTDYVPHIRVDLDDAPRNESGKGPGRVSPSYAKGREKGTLREKNYKNPGRFSEDVGLIEASRASAHGRSMAKAGMNQAFARAGRKIDKSAPAKDQLRPGEAVYRVEGSDLVRVSPKELRKNPVPKGQTVILNEKAVERTANTVAAQEGRTTPGVVFDRVQGIWKFGATVINPGYYVRNFAGEAQNAYLLERPDRLARNAATSGRALRELQRREEAVRKGEKYVPKNRADAELIDKAEAAGAVRAGQYGREIGQQLSSEKKGRRAKLKGAGPLRRVGRVRDNVEDIFRLASFKGGLDRGLTPERAQQRAAKNHFDYGDLSETERKVLRRVMPFYTFSSRNIPLQIKSLVTKPGKFANYQKIREELGKAFGFEEGWEERLPEVEQRAAPFPVKWKGKEFMLSLGPSGLPLTDLNEFPVELLADPTDPESYNVVLDEWLTRATSMVSPAFKTPVELHENISFFFRDQLERDYGPLVPAPAWVSVMPKEFKEMTGYTDNFRNKDGSSGPGWRAKADYLVNILPGPAQFANRMAREGGSAEQSSGSKVVQYFGPRIRPVNREGVALNKAYEEQQKLRKRQAILRQQNHPVNGKKITADNPTPEYTRSLAASRALDKKLRRLQGIPEKPASSPSRRVTKRPSQQQPSGRFSFGGDSESSSGGSSSSGGRFSFR